MESFGLCEPRFAAVADAFHHNLERGGELGAHVSVVVDGVTVVDLFGGHVDKARSRPWEKDTIVNVYSVSKGLTAAVLLSLVDERKLTLETRVAEVWPEFAAHGKGELRVLDLLGHRAGLPALRAMLPAEALYDWAAMTGALAREVPWWTPGTAHGYHAMTFGWLVGEVIRRVSGSTVGALLRERFAGPLGLDMHIGLPESEHARVSDLRGALPPPPEPRTLFHAMLEDPNGMTARAFTNPPALVMPGVGNSRAWRSAELPAANAHTNARGLARFYGALARGGELDGKRVLSEESVARCSREVSRGEDLVLRMETRFSCGFMIPFPELPLPEGAFGHPGMGGSLGFADPKARLGFGYVMNRMTSDLMLDKRPARLIEAAYAALR